MARKEKKAELKLSTISKMNGMEQKFNSSLEAIVADVVARRSLEAPRKLILTIEVSPDEDSEDFIVKPTIKSTLPPHKMPVYTMHNGVGRNESKLKFVPSASADPYIQHELFDDDDDDAEGEGEEDSQQ